MQSLIIMLMMLISTTGIIASHIEQNHENPPKSEDSVSNAIIKSGLNIGIGNIQGARFGVFAEAYQLRATVAAGGVLSMFYFGDDEYAYSCSLDYISPLKYIGVGTAYTYVEIGRIGWYNFSKSLSFYAFLNYPISKRSNLSLSYGYNSLLEYSPKQSTRITQWHRQSYFLDARLFITLTNLNN